MKKSELYKNLLRDKGDGILFWDNVIKGVVSCNRCDVCTLCIKEFPYVVYRLKNFGGKLARDRNPSLCVKTFQKLMKQKGNRLSWELRRIEYITQQMKGMQNHSEIDRYCKMIIKNVKRIEQLGIKNVKRIRSKDV